MMTLVLAIKVVSSVVDRIGKLTRHLRTTVTRKSVVDFVCYIAIPVSSLRTLLLTRYFGILEVENVLF